jgi:hypothetical protein
MAGDPSISCRIMGEDKGENRSEWSAKREVSIKLSVAPESIRAFRSCGTRVGIEIGRTREREEAVHEADKWAESWRRDRSRSHEDILEPIKLFPE